jgi:hypothetical protein
VRFDFHDTTGRTENVHVSVTSKQVTTGSDVVDYLSLPTASTQTPSSFALVVGKRSAAIVLDGRIRGAVRLPPSVSVTASTTGGAAVQDLRTGVAPARSGCATRL